MLTVKVITNVTEKVDSYTVDEPDAAKKLADAMFEATGNTTRVLDPLGNIIHERITPKNAFLTQTTKVQENALMETAMRIMDLMSDMCYAHTLNPYKLGSMDFMEKLQMFCDWAREYEYQYYDTDEYNDFWLEHTEKHFAEKLAEKFGGEN